MLKTWVDMDAYLGTRPLFNMLVDLISNRKQRLEVLLTTFHLISPAAKPKLKISLAVLLLVDCSFHDPAALSKARHEITPQSADLVTMT